MRRVPFLTAVASAAVLLGAPAAASAQTIKTTTGGPLTTKTAGANGSAALTNMTFAVPGAVLAKYVTWQGISQKIVNPLLEAVEILAKDTRAVESRDIKNGTIGAVDLSAGVQAALARADAPVSGQRIQAGTIGLANLSAEVREPLQRVPTAGPPGPQGATGAPGAPGAPGGPLAYARVFADGTVDPAISKNIERVSASGGIYCLRYTGGTPHILNATLDVSGAEAANTLIGATADASTPDWDCTGGANIEVVTADGPTQAGKPASFYITVVV